MVKEGVRALVVLYSLQIMFCTFVFDLFAASVLGCYQINDIGRGIKWLTACLLVPTYISSARDSILSSYFFGSQTRLVLPDLRILIKCF